MRNSNQTSFTDLQTALQEKLELINWEGVITDKLEFVDCHNVSEALKDAKLELETFLGALAHDIAKQIRS